MEDVKDLGLFLEVELLNVPDENGVEKDFDVEDERKKIFEFVSVLNIKLSDELNVGKPELLLRKLKK